MDWLTREAVRYLGYKKNEADDQILSMIEESFQELMAVESKKSIYRIFDLTRTDDGKLIFGNIIIESKNLYKNLKGCDKIILFGATLGTEVDRLIDRTSILDMAKTVVTQACAAALLEEYCDKCQNEIADAMKKENYFLRPRFSPGYGDFLIEYQKDVIQILDCAKHIGLTLTDSYMMSPKKSVTAVIGLSCTDEKCHQHGCEICTKKDCDFRRNIE